MPQGKLELLARGLTHVERYDGGLLTVTHLTLEDYRATGADESYSEGVVDHLRSVEGTAVAALVRDLLTRRGAAAQGLAARHRRPRRRVADRPLAGRRRAPARRRLLDRPGLPASWSRSCAPSSPASFERSGRPTGSSCSTSRPGSRRTTWSPRCGAASGRGRPKVGHAGTLDPFATGLLLVLVGPRDARAAVPDGAAQALRDGRAARLDLDHRRPGGRARAGADAARAARAPDRRAAPAPAGLQRREDRRRARLREGAPRRGGRDRRARGAP